VDVRGPEPRSEGVPKVVEMEIADPGLLHRSLKTDHQLAPRPACACRVEDQFVVGRVLPQALEDCDRPRG
jgi:hypothetical protein